MVNRLAFTLIELVFAIVVMSIAILSLPMMNQIASKGIEANVVQEAIFAASTELNQAVTYFWDANSLEGDATLSHVVWISDTDCDNDTKLRVGHIAQKLHRRCNDDNTTRPTYASDSTLNDVDDTNKSDEALFISTGDTTSASGYKKDYLIDVNITKDTDFSGSDSADIKANIKQIKVTIKDTSGEIITVLYSYACNIGEIDYHKRVF